MYTNRKELNRKMNLFLDWVLKITNVMVIIFVLWSSINIIPSFMMSLFDGNLIDKIPKSNIVYKIDTDEKVRLDDMIIHFTNVIYEQNGDMNIFYEYYDTKLWGTGWSLGTIGDITDNFGNEYISGSGCGSGGIKHKCRHTVEKFSKKADTLIIKYNYYNRAYKVEIPLKVGGASE